MKHVGFRIGALALMMLIISTVARSQGNRATITGVVTDTSGATVADATVSVTNTATGVAFTQKTNAVGIYRIPALDVGSYSIQISREGFKRYERTDIQLSAAQVAQINAELVLGAIQEAVVVTANAPFLEAETSSTAMTMKEDAIRNLPLNAAGGRDALNLMLSTVPLLSGSAQSPSSEIIMRVGGGQDHASTVYIDGVEATAGFQGDVATPGLDALQEMQVQTSGITAELGSTGGGVVMYELKSGTNKFHGSGFEFLQNEALNANTWGNNQFLSGCAPSDKECRQQYKRARYRFNDWGFSAGGPIWKDRTFIFGDYEYYKNTDHGLALNALTVPTAQMLKGDFSQLLTGGARTGPILDGGGNPVINPCTGAAYHYGQIFDPQTQRQVGGVTCADPFPGNIIPPNRLSTVAQKVAAAYSKYYTPTIDRVVNNFPAMAAGTPDQTKRNVDIKVDHSFSDKHRLSFSMDYMKFTGESVNGGFWYTLGDGPFDSGYDGLYPYWTYRITDNYVFTPRVLNSFSFGFSRVTQDQGPHPKVDQTTYGFQAPGAIGNSQQFPCMGFNGANGVGETSIGMCWNLHNYYNAFRIQDTLTWQRGRHGFKFGGTVFLQQMNGGLGGSEHYRFAADTGGPIDPSVQPYVGNGFANFMLGNVQSAGALAVVANYPRRKSLHLFAQDDIKVSQNLTVNVGVLWDYNLRLHDKAGQLTNFDLTQQNPLWAPYKGAWTFANNSGDSFERNEYHYQFGPHIGFAYRLTKKLVARGSYGLYYVPIETMNGGAGPGGSPSTQNFFFFGTNSVPNSVEGSIAFNIDNGYPGQTQYLPRTITQTSLGGYGRVDYTQPDFLRLGRSQNWSFGAQYEVAKDVLLDVRYMANRASGLHDTSLDGYINFPSWSTYQSVWSANCGSAQSPSSCINYQINAPADAAFVSQQSGITVPYPYAGFSGTTATAISPLPQVTSIGYQAWSYGNNHGVSAYNALVAEVKTRNAHGLNIDFSYTLSKATGNVRSATNYSTTWGYSFQSPADLAVAKNWVMGFDRRHLAKGYITYDLPFGRNQKFLSGGGWMDRIVGGWTLGYSGSYGSGTPMGTVWSTVAVPNFFAGTLRANFANGANANNLTHHFSGKLDLTNQQNPSNNGFAPKLFADPAVGTLGNTPYNYNNWRWNPGAASESMSVIKHFSFGHDGRFQASLRGEFYNVFNRHYFGGPDTNLNSSTFGQVTSVWGNRNGQLGARIQW